MKTLKRISKFLLVFPQMAALIVGLTGCGKTSTSSATTAAVYNTSLFSYSGTTCTSIRTGTVVNPAYCTSNPFTYQGTSCYDSLSSSYVDAAYCTATTSSTGYVLSNGYCYSTATGSQVATTYCSTTASTGYYSANGYCYSSATGTIVSTAYCSSTTTTTNSSVRACYGTFYYTNGLATTLVTCTGTNCRGYTLYDYLTKTPVYCQ